MFLVLCQTNSDPASNKPPPKKFLTFTRPHPKVLHKFRLSASNKFIPCVQTNKTYFLTISDLHCLTVSDPQCFTVSGPQCQTISVSLHVRSGNIQRNWNSSTFWSTSWKKCVSSTWSNIWLIQSSKNIALQNVCILEQLYLRKTMSRRSLTSWLILPPLTVNTFLNNWSCLETVNL